MIAQPCLPIIMKMSLLTFALFLVQLSFAFGALSHGLIQTKQEYGRTVKYCQYGDLQLLPRSVFKDYATCSKCTCSKDGLDCATLPTAFTVTVPEDSKCISVLVGCKNVWVFRKNTSRRCPKHQRPTRISGVWKLTPSDV